MKYQHSFLLLWLLLIFFFLFFHCRVGRLHKSSRAWCMYSNRIHIYILYIKTKNTYLHRQINISTVIIGCWRSFSVPFSFPHCCIVAREKKMWLKCWFHGFVDVSIVLFIISIHISKAFSFRIVSVLLVLRFQRLARHLN